MFRIRDCKAAARDRLLGNYTKTIAAYLISLLISFFTGLLTICSFLALLANTGLALSYIKRIFPSFVPDLRLVAVWAIVFSALMVISFILTWLMRVGRRKLVINIARNENPSVSDVFYGFRDGSHVWRLIGVCFLKWLFLSIPMVIPMIARFILWLVHADPNGTVSIAVVTGLTLIVELWRLYLGLGFAFSDIMIIDDPCIEVMQSLRLSMKLMKGRKLKYLWFCITFIFWGMLMNAVPLTSLWVLPYIECSHVMFYLMSEGYLTPGYSWTAGTASEDINLTDSRTAAQNDLHKESAEPVPDNIVAGEIKDGDILHNAAGTISACGTNTAEDTAAVTAAENNAFTAEKTDTAAYTQAADEAPADNASAGNNNTGSIEE